MADFIYRQAAIYAVHKSIFDFFDICDDDEESPITYKDERLLEIIKAIDTQIEAVPSIDAVEVVRCKDCKWYETFYTLNGNEFRCCCRETKESLRNSDDFCSYGERKDG